MEEKAASGLDSKPTPKNLAEKAQEIGAEAPESPQEQSGLVVVLGGHLIQLESLNVQDFLLIDIITGGTPAGTLDRAKAKQSLIGSVISRSKLTPEHIEIMKSDPLRTYKAVGMAITQELFGTDS
jgi:membrane carboxypeptidase/penicillin-binding protein PbpC